LRSPTATRFEVIERAGRGMLKAGESQLLVRAARVERSGRGPQRFEYHRRSTPNVTLAHAAVWHARPAARAREAARGSTPRWKLRFQRP